MSYLDVTVIIFSKGREEILKKTLEYWANQPLYVNVFHNTTQPLILPKSYTNISYTISRSSYGSRCGLAIDSISTNFSILCNDDEVFLTSGLLLMVNRLKQTPKLTSVGAQAIAIGKYGPIITGSRAYSGMLNYVNRNTDPVNRLYAHFDISLAYRNGAIFRLMKSEVMIKLLKVFSELSEVSTPYIYEVTGELIVTAEGTFEYLNQIYWIRNWIIDAVSHSNWNRSLYFHDWYTNPTFESEVKKWKKIVSDNLVLTDVELEVIFNMLLVKRTKIEKQEIVNSSKGRRKVPDKFKYWIRRIFVPKTMPMSLYHCIKDFESSGIEINSKEFYSALKYLDIPLKH